MKDQDLFENAFKYAPIGMALVSLDGKFLKVNRTACDFWGYSEEELLKIDFKVITHPEDLDEDLGNIERLSKNEIPHFKMEKRYIHKQGHILWALLGVSAIFGEDDKPQFYISQILDITEVKLANQALIHNSKMVALGEMTSSIAHEINNPLTIINLNAASIHEVLKKTPIDKNLAESFVKVIHSTVSRINDVVKSLRRLSRQGFNEQFHVCKVGEIIDDALILCNEKFKSSGVKLVKAVTSLDVECRPIELSQVIINLLVNALYAVKSSEVKEVRISVKKKGEKIRIDVSDTGPGVPKDLVDKIMEPYFTTKPLGVGTGLGLSISRSIIADHGGELFLDQSVNLTTFVIELPIEQLN